MLECSQSHVESSSAMVEGSGTMVEFSTSSRVDYNHGRM